VQIYHFQNSAKWEQKSSKQKNKNKRNKKNIKTVKTNFLLLLRSSSLIVFQAQLLECSSEPVLNSCMKILSVKNNKLNRKKKQKNSAVNNNNINIVFLYSHSNMYKDVKNAAKKT